MKITLSKIQWQSIGKKAGWIKTAQNSEGVDIFQFIEDWGDQGYGIALISADGIILDPYIDPSDYPDMILNKSGNGAKVISGKNMGCMIMFHSGQLEGKVGQDWYDSTLGKNKKHLGLDKPKGAI